MIERNAGRQLRLVEDLLSIARIQAGEFEVHRLPLDLAEVVRLGVEAMRPTAREAGLRLELESAGPARVSATPTASTRCSPTCSPTRSSSPPAAAASPCG